MVLNPSIKPIFLNLFYFIKLGMGNELGHIVIVLEIPLFQIGVPNSDLQLFTFSNFGQLGSSGDYFVSWLIDTIVSSIGNNHTTSNIFFISSTSKYRTCPWKFPHGSLIIWQSCLFKTSGSTPLLEVITWSKNWIRSFPQCWNINLINQIIFKIIWIICKGQLISKCLFGIFNSSKKRMKKFNLITMVPQV